MKKEKIEKWIIHLREKYKEQKSYTMRNILRQQIKNFKVALKRLDFPKYTKKEIMDLEI